MLMPKLGHDLFWEEIRLDVDLAMLNRRKVEAGF
jgi:hypothetical protein